MVATKRKFQAGRSGATAFCNLMDETYYGAVIYETYSVCGGHYGNVSMWWFVTDVLFNYQMQ